MGFIFSLLAWPVLGPPGMVRWLAGTLAQEALGRSLDEGPLRAELMALQQRYDAGELSSADYDSREQALLERLSAIRKLKAHYRAQA